MKKIIAIVTLIFLFTPNALACMYSSAVSPYGYEGGMSIKQSTYQDELPIVSEKNWHQKRMTIKQGRFPSSITPEEEQFMKKGFYYIDPNTGRTCMQIGDITDCTDEK